MSEVIKSPIAVFSKQYLVVGLMLIIIDGIWLSVVANRFYQEQLGSLLLDKPNLWAAALFYLLYIFGLVIFVVRPSVAQKSFRYTVFHGALFGLVAYATYDLTNFATLNGWPLNLVIVDLIWGAIMSAAVCSLAFLLMRSSKRI